MGRRRVSDDPQYVAALKRQLGGGRVSNYARLAKTATQSIGAGTTATILWQSIDFNVGGGAEVAGNRFVVPAGKGGLWRIRITIHLDGATVTSGSNYKIEMVVNDSVWRATNNHSGSARDLTAELMVESILVPGEEVKAQLTNFTTGGSVTLNPDSVMALEYLGAL